MSDYYYGVQVLEINDGICVIFIVFMVIVGMVCMVSDVDVEIFFVNKLVLIINVQSVIVKVGKKGMLVVLLQVIVDQLKLVIVVVCVEDGIGDDEEMKFVQIVFNIIGIIDENGQYIGLKVLMGVELVIGVKLCIFGVLGLDIKEVVVVLVLVCQELNVFGYISVWGCKIIFEVKVYCQNFSQCELMVIWLDFFVWDMVISIIVIVYVIVCVLGLCVKIDQEQGWYKMLFNVGVNGVIGISVFVFWDLQKFGIDVDLFNELGIIMLICCDGFCFWGNCICFDDLLFFFESYICIVQVLVDMMVEVYMWVIDKLIIVMLICDIIDGINVKFCELKNNGYIVDGICWFSEEVNDVEIFKVGKLYIDYDYILVFFFENLILCQCIIFRYLVSLVILVNSN